MAADRVGLDRGLVEIAGEVKNEYRKRVIPVADRVMEALRRADQRARADDSKVCPVLA